jgi:hypothetical protein
MDKVLAFIVSSPWFLKQWLANSPWGARFVFLVRPSPMHARCTFEERFQRSKTGNVVWRDKLDGVDDVGLRTGRGLEFQSITKDNVFQSAEEAIAMTGDAHVSGLPDLGSPDNPAHAAVQYWIIRAVKQGHFQMNLLDAKNSKRRVEVLGQASLIVLDPLLRPEAVVDPRGGLNISRSGLLCRPGVKLRKRCS